MSEVRVRIAPSPTGALHLGLVRTALYNWLFARGRGGRFILRIDDTDVRRNMLEVLQPILDGLRWLGIDWDEGPEKGGPHEPYYQSQRTEFYRRAVEELLGAGHAYLDYATPEEVEAERKSAIAQKQGIFRYSRRWMGETASARARFEAQGRKPVVRLKMPTAGVLVLNDLIRGRVEFEWAREQDHVIRRADGTFLYHLASIIDDRDMAITHIIRAEEHLSNTPRQVFILQSLGATLPQFAHLPVVSEPGSKSKLSKRKLKEYMKNRDFADLVARGDKITKALGLETSPETFSPVVVDFYRRVGFLPEAIVNYLALLGWSLDDHSEHFTRQRLVQAFSLERVNRSAASFDPGKLLAFQVRHMLSLPAQERARLCLPYLVQTGFAQDTPENLALVERIVTAAGDRIKVAGDILDYTNFFTDDNKLACDEKAFAKELSRPGTALLLAKFRDQLSTVEPFDPPALEKLMRDFTAAQGIKVGQIIHVLRLAVTGKTVGFGMFDTMAILGRERCLRRIDLALERSRQ